MNSILWKLVNNKKESSIYLAFFSFLSFFLSFFFLFFSIWLCSLDNKEIKPVNPKGNQSWILIERTDAEAETPILWPSDVKSWLTGKDPDAGKDWEQEEKGVTEDEMVTDSRYLNLSKTPGDKEGQGGLVGCRPWWWQGVRPNLTTET